MVKKNRKNGTPELRILNHLEEEAEKKYDEEVFVNDTRVANVLKKIKNKNIVMSTEEKFQIISVLDAVKTILKELNITEIDRELAEATLKLIQDYNGIRNISERSLLRLNDSRDIILKQRGRKVDNSVVGNKAPFFKSSPRILQKIVRGSSERLEDVDRLWLSNDDSICM